MSQSAFSVYKKQQRKPKLKVKQSKTVPVVHHSTPQTLTNGIKKSKDKTKRIKLQVKKQGLQKNLIDLGSDLKKQRLQKKRIRHEKKQRLQTKPVDLDSDEDEEIPQLVIVKPPKANDTFTKARKLLKWLIHPVKVGKFFKDFWEVGPLHVTRGTPDYYKHLLTSADIDTMLKENPLYFGRNVDVVKYQGGKRITENPAGRAKHTIVWDAYNAGYSLRFLNPQSYNKKVQMVLANLQEYFGAMVGANVYLTPAGSQGFAPHFDDIEAFIVQLEGKKYWKLYKPSNLSDNLARFSSKDFTREELGKPIAEIVLNSGDILYFPRGVVHEAKTDDESHSLHMTISTYQRTSYADLLEKILPEALNAAARDNIDYRRGLPIGYLKQIGTVNNDRIKDDRLEIINIVKDLVSNLSNYIDVDGAADQLGRKFVYDSVPPVLEPLEEQCTSKYDGGEFVHGRLTNSGTIDPDTEVRLLRYYGIRLVIEDEEAHLYYSVDNSKVYHGEEEQFITVDKELIPVIKALLDLYPEFVEIDKLPCKQHPLKLNLLTELWDYGMIITKEPLKCYDDK